MAQPVTRWAMEVAMVTCHRQMDVNGESGRARGASVMWPFSEQEEAAPLLSRLPRLSTKAREHRRPPRTFLRQIRSLGYFSDDAMRLSGRFPSQETKDAVRSGGPEAVL